MEFDFKEELKIKQDYINKILEKYIVSKNKYDENIKEAMNYSLLAGGKRLRPILMFEVYKLFKQDIEECISFAVAMEMIHNFSLIHDDLPAIDNDDFRHGKLTNHKVYGESTALLAGDALLNYSYVIISQDLLKNSQNNKKLNAFFEFSSAVESMIVGEQVDTEYEKINKSDITLEDLEFIHKNKTGALIEASVKIGAILGEANVNEINNLTNYAKDIGLAFQIKDDILSAIGDEKETGKPVGNDEARNKTTYVTIYGVEKAKNMLEEKINSAKEALKNIDKNTMFLEMLAEYIMNRKK